MNLKMFWPPVAMSGKKQVSHFLPHGVSEKRIHISPLHWRKERTAKDLHITGAYTSPHGELMFCFQKWGHMPEHVGAHVSSCLKCFRVTILWND